MTHIAHALWDAARRPEPNWQGKAKTVRCAPTPRPGVCALTGEAGMVWDGTHVVSDLFTGWDGLRFRNVDPAGLGFGPAGAWVIRLQVAMRRAHVLRGGELVMPDPPGLFAALVALPHEPTSVVSVPTSGQKHLLPWAEPGAVRTDNMTLRWSAGDVDRLRLYRWLRGLGFGETALSEPAPRWVAVRGLAAPDVRMVMSRWGELDPWRAVPTRLDVAARATRTPKEGGSKA
ncbi:MAG: hypothetical protein ACRDSN_11595 [Pseudonocardiaceae bacterium]